MAYRNKIYVCFDADTDMSYYRMMQAWHKNNHLNFTFYNAHDIDPNPKLVSEFRIKFQLRKRFESTKSFIVLIGEKTQYLYRYVRWEMEEALKRNLPIIAVNLNGWRSQDLNRCPPIIREKLAVHVSFNMAIIKHALETWPNEHINLKNNRSEKPYYYKDNVYKKLKL